MAEVNPEELSIFLFGPLPALESISDGDVTVTLDLLDLEPGVYALKPLVSVSANEVEIRSTEPETMSVTISEIEEQPDEGVSGGTATPTPRPVSTPAP